MSSLSPLEELQSIERLATKPLDDASFVLLSRARVEGVLNDDDWQKVLERLRQALEFLGEPNKTLWKDQDGKLHCDPDADPRNADWIRIAAAHRLAGHYLPMWAALWLWQCRLDGSPEFWQEIGRVAGELGYEVHRKYSRSSHS